MHIVSVAEIRFTGYSDFLNHSTALARTQRPVMYSTEITKNDIYIMHDDRSNIQLKIVIHTKFVNKMFARNCHHK